MNPLFLPNDPENDLIHRIQKYCRNDFALIRITKTMLRKSIIDASEEIRIVFRDGGIINFKETPQVEYHYCPAIIISQDGVFNKIRTSLYRPKTKKGDPRFWVSNFRKFVFPSELVYFTVQGQNLVAIPLIDYPDFENNIIKVFGTNDEERELINDFYNKISAIKSKGWILSVSPNRLNDKDIGETLERELGIKANNLKTADYEGQIELKGKKSDAKTRDSLFSMTPNWYISTVKSVNELVSTYGYADNKYTGYKALFVTVSSKPNKQGLFLEVDEENEQIHQKCLKDGIINDVCTWNFNDVKERLFNKHPKTLWILADHKKDDDRVFFKYTKVQFTQRPIFAQFLALIQQGIITYDWRHRTDDGAKIKIPSSKLDYGQGFRMNPADRKQLFGEIIDLDL